MQSVFRKRWYLMAVAMIAMALVPQMAQAALVYSVTMNGANESPPAATPGFGSGFITFDTTANTMRVQVTFSGLLGNTTAAHIHAATLDPGTGTAGVATQVPSFVGFPLGVTSGSFDTTFDMTLASSYRAAYITANGGTPASAFNALLNASASGRAYFNIHTAAFPGGEIRGFLTAVPEPSSMALTGLIAGSALLYRRASRKQKVDKA